MLIINKFFAIYKFWNEFRNNFPKKHRISLAVKIDSLFLGSLEYLFIASRLHKDQKIPYLHKASGQLDLLKFFLQFAWDLKVLDNKKYILLSKRLDEIGRMLGGWTKDIQKQTPRQ